MSDMQPLDAERAQRAKDNAQLSGALRAAETAAVADHSLQNLAEKVDRRMAANAVHTRMQSQGPLPLTTATLEFLPRGAADQYEQRFDGTFRLVYLHSTDEASLLEHTALISGAKLRVLPPGETPESLELKERQASARAAAVLEHVNALAASEQAAQRLRAKETAQAQLNRQFGVGA